MSRQAGGRGGPDEVEYHFHFLIKKEGMGIGAGREKSCSKTKKLSPDVS